jgi:hypothetical protein
MAPAVLLSRARDAAARAVQADPALADAHAAVGYVRFLLEWDWPGAEAALRRAVALDASCAVGVRTWDSFCLRLHATPRPEPSCRGFAKSIRSTR